MNSTESRIVATTIPDGYDTLDMSSSIDQKRRTIQNGTDRKVQAKGTVTLPKCWRDEHGIDKDDQVFFFENDDGTLEVIPPK